ncbi:Gldg family protein [Ruminococcus sp.]|uniref:Gldg family protein n=1 Tax=Ruminococcus sp. TaxID=41978 RepID=UPI0038700D2E
MKQNRNTSENQQTKKPKNRKLTRGAMSILLTALFIAGVVLINIILSVVTDSHPLYIDVTENASYQLQKETKEYLSEVKDPVDIYVLQKETDFESGDSSTYKYRVQANKLIHAMENSSDNITLHYVDLAAEPTFTTPYTQVDWTKSHAILVKSGDLYRAVDLTDLFDFDQEQYSQYGTIVITGQKVEQALTTAIVNVTTKEKTKVTVLTGQGEQDMSAFTKLLENNAYEIETVSLLNESISDDSEFVIIYDPDVDLDDKAYETLTKWLDNDGKFGHNLFYFPNDQHKLSDFPNLNALLADYGMEVQYGYIYENSENYIIPGANHYISIYDYGEDTTYTDNLRNFSIPVVMMLTMPVKITDDTMAKPLLTSSDKSFLFPRDMEEKDLKSFEPKTESLNGAAIGIRNDGTEGSKNSSVVVIGSYDALTTNYLSSTAYNNAAYFVNLFNTLSNRDDISVVIEGKDPSSNELGITSMNAILFPSILVRFVIPIAVLVIGLIIWIRRRHK